MSIALLGALLVVASPAMAEYEQFMVWRQDTSYWNKTDASGKGYVGNLVSYGPEASMLTLGSLGKYGTANATNGTIQYYTSSAAWWVTPKNSTDYTINFDGSLYGADNPLPNIVDIGIALKGAMGATGVAGIGASGLCANISLNLKELLGDDAPMEWASVGAGLSTLASSLAGIAIDYQTYLNGNKVNPTTNILGSTSWGTVNTANDAQETYLYTGMVSELLGGIGNGAVGAVTFKLASGLRNGSSVALVAVVEPSAVPPAAPEPATIALMGLGLAGLGIARRRMRK